MQKRVVNSSVREYRCDPDSVRKKEKYWRERKIYKELIRTKKRKASEALHIKLSNLRTTHPREFWKVVSKDAAVHHKPIDMVDMAAYFHKECSDQLHICNNLPVLIQDDFLDDEIFEGEVFCAIKRLKQNKAPGLDGLPPKHLITNSLYFLQEFSM